VAETHIFHRQLAQGGELAGEVLPDRKVVAIIFRLTCGAAIDPPDKIGVANLVAQTLDKGTADHDMIALAQEFDRIGAQHHIGAATETSVVALTILSQHLRRAIELVAEVLRRPSFPAEQVQIQKLLAAQALQALEDNPPRKMYRLLGEKSWGPVLGRDSIGTVESLQRIERDDVESWWAGHYSQSALQVSAAGAFDPQALEQMLNDAFADFGPDASCPQLPPPEFEPGRYYVAKDCEQQPVGVAYPSLPPDHDDAYAEAVALNILSGGMSARLFTEVREKHGLAYWVRANREWRRGAGRIRLGAGTRPDRVDKTLSILLAEVDRLGRDVEQEEIDRAKVGMIADMSTRQDGTQARASAISLSLFYRGHPVSFEEKRRKVEAVTIEDVRRYLAAQDRSSLCVLTLGPKDLSDQG
jgi:predicted Zn-dependent peptidase